MASRDAGTERSVTGNLAVSLSLTAYSLEPAAAAATTAFTNACARAVIAGQFFSVSALLSTSAPPAVYYFHM